MEEIMADTTRAQIGFYETTDMKSRPVAVLSVPSNGHPTGEGGLVGRLIDVVSPVLAASRVYNAGELAVDAVRGLDGVVALTAHIHEHTRFYYALTPEGVNVYDARQIPAENIRLVNPLFFTSWKDDAERRKIEADIQDLEARLKNLYLNRESVKRRAY
jgi:hypothetical protein